MYRYTHSRVLVIWDINTQLLTLTFQVLFNSPQFFRSHWR